MTDEQIQKMIEWYKSEEGQRQFIEGIERRNEEKRKENLEIRELFSNTDYFEWVVEYLKDKRFFHDDYWYCNIDSLPEEERNNILKLHLAVRAVDAYAKEHSIVSYEKDDVIVYWRVNYNGTLLDIGMYFNPETNNICNIAADDDKEAIDYKDIADFTQQPEFEVNGVWQLKKE